MIMNCEWCGAEIHENDRMIELITRACGAITCYVCAIEWVSQPKLVLDFDPMPWNGPVN